MSSFGNLDLRHYDSKVITLDRTRTYGTMTNGEPRRHFKPAGLWLSVKGEDDWPTWSRSEEFMLDEITVEHRVELWPNANVRVIAGLEEFDAFHHEYEADVFGIGENAYRERKDWWGNLIPYYKYDYIDWEAVAADYDGLIINPYLYQRRTWGPSWYNSWDVASGCIWNLAAIRKVTWMIPELEELKRKMARWIDVAVEQANNRMLYGTDNPGGKGRQQYRIDSPFFPNTEHVELENAQKGIAPWMTTTTSTD